MFSNCWGRNAGNSVASTLKLRLGLGRMNLSVGLGPRTGGAKDVLAMNMVGRPESDPFYGVKEKVGGSFSVASAASDGDTNNVSQFLY